MTLNIWLSQGEEEDVLGELDNILAELEGEAVPRCNIDILILIKASILKYLDGLSVAFVTFNCNHSDVTCVFHEL